MVKYRLVPDGNGYKNVRIPDEEEAFPAGYINVESVSMPIGQTMGYLSVNIDAIKGMNEIYSLNAMNELNIKNSLMSQNIMNSSISTAMNSAMTCEASTQEDGESWLSMLEDHDFNSVIDNVTRNDDKTNENVQNENDNNDDAFTFNTQSYKKNTPLELNAHDSNKTLQDYNNNHQFDPNYLTNQLILPHQFTNAFIPNQSTDTLLLQPMFSQAFPHLRYDLDPFFSAFKTDATIIQNQQSMSCEMPPLHGQSQAHLQSIIELTSKSKFSQTDLHRPAHLARTVSMDMIHAKQTPGYRIDPEDIRKTQKPKSNPSSNRNYKDEYDSQQLYPHPLYNTMNFEQINYPKIIDLAEYEKKFTKKESIKFTKSKHVFKKGVSQFMNALEVVKYNRGVRGKRFCKTFGKDFVL